ncbi:hypothetical protein [Acidisoma cladoniae]|jgi:hypothetical protein|uniref:hypothetical protein n=1 Tax=Acidisoma cladoniae TaxID=3040935 RepID=UPI00254CB235|nr:hypothetical protein [Acidisoma sp. PAMC 29798]
MDVTGQAITDIADRHGISTAAVEALYEALHRSGSAQAQFNHPDLGGMGQWSRGGMTQIGDMFNATLKAKVDAACRDLAELVGGDGTGRFQRQVQGADDADFDRDIQSAASHRSTHWWPDDLGAPAASGAQNDMRYACFPDQHRLVIETNGRLTVYDTGEHRLTGFSQQQSQGQDLAFSGPDGTVGIDRFRVVEGG